MAMAQSESTRKSLKPPARGMRQEAAFQHLREMIVMGKIAPGSWVVEADLAERLGFSRTPIHGALQLLQSAGYAIEHRNGTKTRFLIPPLTMEDAKELYRIVGRLEGLIGERIAALPKSKRAQIAKELTRVNTRIQNLAKQGQGMARQVFDLDSEFHNIFVEAAAGPRLMSLHRAVKPQIERYWRLYANSIMTDLSHSVREHNEIIASIRKGSAEGIEAAVEANWVTGFSRISKLIEIFGERGNW